MENRLGALSIGVLKDTTTYQQFNNKKLAFYRNFVPIDATIDGTSQSDNSKDPKGINALERALSALDHGGSLDDGTRIQAFASDAVILQSLFEEGKNQEGTQGHLSYTGGREPYKNRDFAIFPPPSSGKYLLNLEEEEYGIAIKKGTENERTLLEVIHSTLEDLNQPTSELAQAQANIKRYANGGNEQQKSSVSQPPSDPGNGDSPLRKLLPWIIVVFAVAVMIALFKFPRRVFASLRIPGGKIKLRAEGSGEIMAKNITSTDGGVIAKNNTGEGVTANYVTASKDITLTNGTSPPQSFQTSSSSQTNPTPGIEAQSLNAGGNITITQFVSGQAKFSDQLDFFKKEIGIVNPGRDFTISQVKDYCNAWRSLRALQLKGRELWKNPNLENLIAFAEKLIETTDLVHEELIFFQTPLDGSRLFSDLRAFRQIKIGRQYLFEINSLQAVERFYREQSIPSGSSLKREIEEKINENKIHMWDYDETVSRIGSLFQKILSN